MYNTPVESQQQLRHRKKNRLSWYDYSQSGWYYVTVCTKRHECWFGEVVNGVFCGNEYGMIVEKQWEWIAEQYPYIRLDEYVVMPNHFHGILVISGNDNGNHVTNFGGDNPRIGNPRSDNTRIVTTIHGTKMHNNIKYRRHNTLSKTMSAFKTTSSKIIHQSGLKEFAWQRSFYDRIIRDTEGLMKIRQYIQNNPKKWNNEKNIQ